MINYITITQQNLDSGKPWIAPAEAIKGFEHCWANANTLKVGDMLPFHGLIKPEQLQ